MRQALVEFITTTPILTESENGKIILEGVAGKVGVKNRNGRMYKTSTMQKVVESVQPLIVEGAFTGELDHPNDGHHGSLERTAFRFTDFHMEGDEMKFKAELLETPSGDILKGLIKGGVRVGMSTRGAGQLKIEVVNGEKVPVVQEDFQLFGVDAVKVPSSEAGIIRLAEGIENNLNLENNLKEDNMAGEITTIAVLKQMYPDLVAQVEDTIRTVEQSKTQAAETRAQVAESALATEKNKTTQLESQVSVLEQVKSALGVSDKADDAAAVAADGLKSQVESLRSEITSMKEAEKAKEERVVIETALKEAFETVVKDDEAEEVLRKRINPLQYESVEALNAKVTEYKGILEDTGFKKFSIKEGKVAGKGQLNEDTEDTENKNLELSENEALSYRLAGIPIKG